MPTALEKRFTVAMFDIYRRAKEEAGYTANRFKKMVFEHEGIEAARILLHASTVSEGYEALWERKRLDLTVEALVLDPEWRELFTDDERMIAIKRLKQYGYSDQLPPA